jgi:hypothetical protein
MKKVIAIFAIVALASCGAKKETTSVDSTKVDSTVVKADSAKVDSTVK